MKVPAAVLALVLAAGAAQAADVRPVGKTGTSLEVIGPIAEGDDRRLAQAAVALLRKGKPLERVFLNSPGGQVQAGLRLALAINALNVDTVVGADATCASACVSAFSAGKKRVAFATSRIGVHAASSVHTNSLGERIPADDDRAKAATVDLARMYAALGMPHQIIGRLVTTPNDSIAWLTQSDAIAWKIDVIPVRGVEPPPEAIGNLIR